MNSTLPVDEIAKKAEAAKIASEKEKEEREKAMKAIHKTAWDTYQMEKFGDIAKTPEEEQSVNNSTSNTTEPSKNVTTPTKSASGKKSKAKAAPKKLFDFEVTIKDHNSKNSSLSNVKKKTFVGKFHPKEEESGTKGKKNQTKKQGGKKKDEGKQDGEKKTTAKKNKTSKLCSGSANERPNTTKHLNLSQAGIKKHDREFATKVEINQEKDALSKQWRDIAGGV